MTGREEHVSFAPGDCMIPDLECCVAFEFGEDAVTGADGVVSCLEDGGDCFGDSEGEDEEI